MKFNRAKKIKEIAEFLGCEYVGDESHLVHGLNEIHKVETGDLVFVDHPKYYNKALESAATTILIDKKVDCPSGKALLISKDPFFDYNKLAKAELPFKSLKGSVGENTVISKSTIIQPNVTIGNDVKIGEDCILHPGVVIYDNCILEDNIIIHANTVIGGDAFYYQKREKQYYKMHTCGRVIIRSHVEIGAACTIDRGVSGDTIVGEGSKLDNQVHIGHDSVLGKNCLLAGQVGLAGCVILEDNVTLWGQVGVISDIRIASGAVVYGQSGVSKDLEKDKIYFGSPAMEAREFKRQLSILKRLPELFKKGN